jgi:hypothetical protein
MGGSADQNGKAGRHRQDVRGVLMRRAITKDEELRVDDLGTPLKLRTPFGRSYKRCIDSGPL